MRFFVVVSLCVLLIVERFAIRVHGEENVNKSEHESGNSFVFAFFRGGGGERQRDLHETKFPRCGNRTHTNAHTSALKMNNGSQM